MTTLHFSGRVYRSTLGGSGGGGNIKGKKINNINRNNCRRGLAHQGTFAPSFCHINNKDVLGEKAARKFSHLINLHSMKPHNIDINRAIEIKNLIILILVDVKASKIAAEAMSDILAEVEILCNTGIFAQAKPGTTAAGPLVQECLKTAHDHLGHFGSHLPKTKSMTSAEPGYFKRLIDLSSLFKPRVTEKATAKEEVPVITTEPVAIKALLPKREPEDVIVESAVVPRSATVVPELPKKSIQQLREELKVTGTRHSALELLRDMGQDSSVEAALPELIDILSNPANGLLGVFDMDHVVDILKNIGPAAKEALPKLKDLLFNMKKDKDNYYFLRICHVISKVERANSSAVFMSYLRLLDRQYEFRKTAAFYIALDFYMMPDALAANLRDEIMIASQRKLIMREFIKQIYSLYKNNSIATISSLYRHNLDVIVPALRELLESNDLELTELAAIALRELEPAIKGPT